MIKKHLVTSDEKLKHWGYGEWVEEPDVVEFEYEGYQCAVYRVMVYEGNPLHLSLGHLCGYVVIPEGHPWYGSDWDSGVDAACHFGLTHFGAFEPGRFKNSDKFCIGFDCGHSTDITPGTEAFMKEQRAKLSEKYPSLFKHDLKIFESTYKNVNFVMEECKGLVEQAIKVGKEAKV